MSNFYMDTSAGWVIYLLIYLFVYLGKKWSITIQLIKRKLINNFADLKKNQIFAWTQVQSEFIYFINLFNKFNNLINDFKKKLRITNQLIKRKLLIFLQLFCMECRVSLF